MISASLWARAQETPKNGANTFFTKARKAHGLLMSPASNEHGFPQISLEIPPVNPSGSSTSRSTRSPWTLDDVLGAASGQPGSICLYLDVPERSPESIYIYNYIYICMCIAKPKKIDSQNSTTIINALLVYLFFGLLYINITCFGCERKGTRANSHASMPGWRHLHCDMWCFLAASNHRHIVRVLVGLGGKSCSYCSSDQDIPRMKRKPFDMMFFLPMFSLSRGLLVDIQ